MFSQASPYRVEMVPLYQRFYPTNLVKTTIPLRVGEQRQIYTSTLRVSVFTPLFTFALGDSCITFIKELQILLKLQLSLYKQFRSSFKSVYGFTEKSLVQLLIKILQIIVTIGIAMSSVTDKNRCSAAGSVFGQFQYTKPPEPASLHAKKILS